LIDLNINHDPPFSASPKLVILRQTAFNHGLGLPEGILRLTLNLLPLNFQSFASGH
jgi:hypothetical protein